jgi:hypothetical protein
MKLGTESYGVTDLFLVSTCSAGSPREVEETGADLDL